MSNLTQDLRDQRAKVSEFQTALELATTQVPNGMAVIDNSEPLQFLRASLSRAAQNPDQHAEILSTAQSALSVAQAKLDNLQSELDGVQAIARQTEEALKPLKADVYQAFEALLTSMERLGEAAEKANAAAQPLQKEGASPRFQAPNLNVYNRMHLVQMMNGLVGYGFVESQRDLLN